MPLSYDDIVVGMEVTFTGKYWYTSYQEAPWGTHCQGEVCRVTMKVDRKLPCPILIKGRYDLGWISPSQLEKYPPPPKDDDDIKELERKIAVLRQQLGK